MGKKLLLIGGGGHCKSVLDCVVSSGQYDEIGIVDKEGTAPYRGIQVVGNDDDLPTLYRQGWEYAFVSVGSIGNTSIRRKLYNHVKETGFTVPVITDPSAVIAGDVEMREGVFVGKGALINAGSTLGVCAIINSGAVVEHECHISDFAHVSPGAVLCGQVGIGEDSHVGAAAVVRQQIIIGEKVLVGAGSVVVNNLPDGVKAFGNPCRVIE